MRENDFPLNQMYHNLPLHIGLAFSLAEGNKVGWISDCPRYQRLAFPRKDFFEVRITPCFFIDHHLILGNIFSQGKGDSSDWGLPSTPFLDNLLIYRNGASFVNISIWSLQHQKF